MSDEQDGGSRLQKRNLAAEKKLTETDPIDEEAQERIVKLLEQDQVAPLSIKFPHMTLHIDLAMTSWNFCNDILSKAEQPQHQ